MAEASNESASFRKLSSSNDLNDGENNSDFCGYRIFNICQMFSILAKFFCCKACCGEINLKEKKLNVVRILQLQ